MAGAGHWSAPLVPGQLLVITSTHQFPPLNDHSSSAMASNPMKSLPNPNNPNNPSHNSHENHAVQVLSKNNFAKLINPNGGEDNTESSEPKGPHRNFRRPARMLSSGKVVGILKIKLLRFMKLNRSKSLLRKERKKMEQSTKQMEIEGVEKEKEVLGNNNQEVVEILFTTESKEKEDNVEVVDAAKSINMGSSHEVVEIMFTTYTKEKMDNVEMVSVGKLDDVNKLSEPQVCRQIDGVEEVGDAQVEDTDVVDISTQSPSAKWGDRVEEKKVGGREKSRWDRLY
ncbi:hypothetical protein K7X08_016491 [Anisodus acutangulus]|uniref:Uncharacterized protein n=1 Tax=Anisodus acutangulus TaxID=402998 RepID=A0A9Q1LH36_9SOLA|nr:hypothetical protein K7X08_016491 [Anisodus acutangulus]